MWQGLLLTQMKDCPVRSSSSEVFPTSLQTEHKFKLGNQTYIGGGNCWCVHDTSASPTITGNTNKGFVFVPLAMCTVVNTVHMASVFYCKMHVYFLFSLSSEMQPEVCLIWFWTCNRNQAHLFIYFLIYLLIEQVSQMHFLRNMCSLEKQTEI